MWDPRTGIEVRIKPYGSDFPYQEWKDSSITTANRTEAYIEAVSHERFVIEIIVHRSFNWTRAPHLSIKCRIDGGTINAWRVLDRPPRDRKAVASETVSKVVESYASFVNASCKSCGFTFGEASLNDDPTLLSSDEEAKEIFRRGKIEVVIQRGRLIWRKKTREQKLKFPAEGKVTSSETTKIVARDNGKSHYTKPIELGDHGPIVTERIPIWKAASGKAGDEIKSTFFYTSRTYLEKKSLVPSRTNQLTGVFDVENDQVTRAPTHGQCPNKDVIYQLSRSAGVGNVKTEDTESSTRKGCRTEEAYKVCKDWTSGGARDEDDEEPPPPLTMIKIEKVEDLYNLGFEPPSKIATVEEEDDLYNVTPGPSTDTETGDSALDRAFSVTLAAMTSSAQQSKTIDEEVAILERLEEIRLWRRLRVIMQK